MLLLSLMLSNALASTEPLVLKTIPCFDTVTSAISALGTPEKWIKLRDGVGSRIKGHGHVEVYPEEKQTKFVVVGPVNSTHFLLKAPACEGQVAQPTPHHNHFSDFDLAELYAAHPEGGAVYVWSPHMELSISEVDRLFKTKVDRPLTIIMDPKADTKLADKIAQEKGWPKAYFRRMASEELTLADVAIHLLSTVYYKNGRVLKRVPGYNGVKMNDMMKAQLK